MRYRNLNNNDYSFGSNNLDFLNNRQSIEQAIQTKLKLLQGEWWEDITLGLPLFQSILGRVNPDVIKTSIQKFISDALSSLQSVTKVNVVDVITVKRKSKAIINITLSDEENFDMEVEF